jgi:hypothetical protein
MSRELNSTESFLTIVKEDREFGIFLLGGERRIFFPA